MNYFCELGKKEIEEIIAEHFGCAPSDVVLSVNPVSVGYGPGEHTEYLQEARVNLKGNPRSES